MQLIQGAITHDPMPDVITQDQDRETQPRVTSSSNCLSTDSKQSRIEKIIKEKREAVKVAIRQLYERNLGFEFLKDEVTDIPHLIELYRELGLNVPSGVVGSLQASTAQVQPIENGNQKRIPDSSIPFSRSLGVQNPALDPSNNGTEQSNNTEVTAPELRATEKEQLRSRPPVASPTAQLGGVGIRSPKASTLQKEPSTDLPSKPVSESSRQPAQPSTSLPSKPVAVTNAPASKPLERKDYIAKLLAAKEAVKSSTVPKTPKPDIAKAQESRTLPKEAPLNEPSEGSRHEKISSDLAPTERSSPRMVASDKTTLTEKAVNQVPLQAIPTEGVNHEPDKNESATVPAKDRTTEDISQKNLPVGEVPVQPAVQPPTLSNGTKKTDVKDPVQTELVRQRLEALRKTSQQQRTASAITEAQRTQPTDSISQQLSISIRSPAVTQNMQTPFGGHTEVLPTTGSSQPKVSGFESQEYSPANSFFTFGDRKPFSGLPGLSPFNPSIPGVPFPQAASSADMKPVLEKDDEPQVMEAEQSMIEPAGNSVQFVNTEPPQSEAISSRSSSPMESREVNAINQPTPPEADFLPSLPLAPINVRKRATAADFIDGSDDRNKRQYTPNDHSQLVIEVSDDEDGVESGEESDTDAKFRERSRPSLASRGFRDVPPLSDFPSRPRSGPAQNTGFKAPNSKGLAQTEEQIRLLNQKIAEMEQRKRAKAKQAFSEAQSQASSSPAPGPVTGMSQHIEKQRQALEDASSQLEAQKSSIAAAKSVLQEKLGAERDTHARIVARAEKERQEAALAETKAEREIRLRRKAALEAALPKLDTQIEAAKAKLEDMRKQQEEIQEEIQRGHEGRQALVEELNSLLASFNAEDDKALNGIERSDNGNDIERAMGEVTEEAIDDADEATEDGPGMSAMNCVRLLHHGLLDVSTLHELTHIRAQSLNSNQAIGLRN